MATFKKFNKDKRPKRNTQSLLFKRKRFCRFTVAGVEEIDYKDIDTLRDFIAENGKIIPARLSWPCCPIPTSIASDTGLKGETHHGNHSSGKSHQPGRSG